MCQARHQERRWREGPGHADGQRAPRQAALRAERIGAQGGAATLGDVSKPARRVARASLGSAAFMAQMLVIMQQTNW